MTQGQGRRNKEWKIVCILPTLPQLAGCDISKAGFNTKFSFSLTDCPTKDKEYILSYYLPIAGRRKDGLMLSPRALARSEMPTVSYRVWTRDTDSIPHNDNRYTHSWEENR